MDFEFVNPRKTTFVEPTYRGELPHLYKDFSTYFVTFRLWDAVEKNGARNRSAMRVDGKRGDISPDDLVRLSEPPLRLGSCLLANPTCAEVVQDALLWFDGERYRLLAWCIMPNHVHVVFQPFGDYLPAAILHSWKSYSAHRINRLMGRTGSLWERESFDHVVRSVENLEVFIWYVERNPVTAGLCRAASDWSWSSAPRRDSDGALRCQQSAANRTADAAGETTLGHVQPRRLHHNCKRP